MATLTEYTGRRRLGTCSSRWLVSWLVLALLVCLPGCRGCSKSSEELDKEKQQAEEKAKKKKEEEVKPFEAGQPRAVPSNSKNVSSFYKPGHWISQTWPNVKSNLGDFQGELQTDVVNYADAKSTRAPLVAVPYEMTNLRPASLAKKQPKSFESFAWVPPPWIDADHTEHTARTVDCRLAAAGGGATAIEQSLGLLAMPSYQYFFVVLSNSARFEYLTKKIDSIRWHNPRPEMGSELKYYEVVTMPPNRRPTLPTNSLYWTSIAYLLWDDSDLAQWDLDQQQALVDWLHWGGQIIVSGPDALTQLQGGFLRSYLPATVDKARTFTLDDLAEFQYWAGRDGSAPMPVRPWAGAVLKKDPLAEYLPYTNNTIIERPVGRGRIVVSAFRITGPEFTGWRGCDSFFNACLMRRPAREFGLANAMGDVRIQWVGKEPAENQDPEPPPAENSNSTPVPMPPLGIPGTIANAATAANRSAWRTFLDASKFTSLRYFVRDAGLKHEDYAPDVMRGASQPVGTNQFGQPIDARGNIVPYPTNDGDDSDFLSPSPDRPGPGVCAWNDFSPVAQAARKALHDASGITVPDRGFIVWIVVGYICVLVPVNWLFFRLIRRVEWAWIAAPLIAIGCTVFVVQKAQLNIGFARSRNEIAVIETQPGYARAHVTRYTDLYTSLATSYELQVADPGGQILPFARDTAPALFKIPYGESRGEVVCRRGDDTRLSGFNVRSNNDDYIHSEEMADFGGAITLHHDSDGALRVVNGSKHPLENCRVIQMGDNPGDARLFTIQRFDAGATARLKDPAPFDRKAAAASKMVNVAANQLQEEMPVNGPASPGKPTVKFVEPTGELNIEAVAQVALGLQDMRPGEVCLVARVADKYEGLTVTPSAKQFRQAALLVAHLDPGKLPSPQRDEGTKPQAPAYEPLLPENTEE